MKYIFFCFTFLVSSIAFAQNVFWSENFGTGCTQGQKAHGLASSNGVWQELLTGQNGINRNKWYVSSTEAGIGVGNCGDGCINNSSLLNRTLHIGSDTTFFVDPGANYLAGSPNYNTNVRIESPLINCAGQNAIQLSFKYLVEGVAGVDFFDVQYSPNGGITWTVIALPPASFNQICTPQGSWTNYSIMLPASANNNSNVKIGFRWQSTDPIGADPSVAIDDITLGPPSSTVQKEEKQKSFSLFPNPCYAKLIIRSNDQQASGVLLQLQIYLEMMLCSSSKMLQ